MVALDAKNKGFTKVIRIQRCRNHECVCTFSANRVDIEIFHMTFSFLSSDVGAQFI